MSLDSTCIKGQMCWAPIRMKCKGSKRWEYSCARENQNPESKRVGKTSLPSLTYAHEWAHIVTHLTTAAYSQQISSPLATCYYDPVMKLSFWKLPNWKGHKVLVTRPLVLRVNPGDDPNYNTLQQLTCFAFQQSISLVSPRCCTIL